MDPRADQAPTGPPARSLCCEECGEALPEMGGIALSSSPCPRCETRARHIRIVDDQGVRLVPFSPRLLAASREVVRAAGLAEAAALARYRTRQVFAEPVEAAARRAAARCRLDHALARLAA